MSALRLHEDPDRTTPIGMARYAVEFMQAAQAADEAMGTKSGHGIVAPIPVMFLVGQSIELALKAYLLHRGVSLREIRKDCGHELHRSLRKAKELGLLSHIDLSAEEHSVLTLLDALYSTKQLQYIVTGAKRFPVFGPLERAALRLLHAICPLVGYTARDLPNVA